MEGERRREDRCFRDDDERFLSLSLLRRPLGEAELRRGVNDYKHGCAIVDGVYACTHRSRSRGEGGQMTTFELSRSRRRLGEDAMSVTAVT